MKVELTIEEVRALRSIAQNAAMFDRLVALGLITAPHVASEDGCEPQSDIWRLNHRGIDVLRERENEL